MKLVSFGTSARQRNALMKMNSKIDLDFRLNVKIYAIFFLLAVSSSSIQYISIGHNPLHIRIQTSIVSNCVLDEIDPFLQSFPFWH